MDEVLVTARYPCLLPAFNEVSSHHFAPLFAEVVRLAERVGYSVTFKTPTSNGHWRFILRKLHRPEIRVNCKTLSDAFISVIDLLAANRSTGQLVLRYDAALHAFKPQHRQKLSKAATRRAMVGYRKVSAEGIVYPNITACARGLGMSAKTISNRINSSNPRFVNFFFI